MRKWLIILLLLQLPMIGVLYGGKINVTKICWLKDKDSGLVDYWINTPCSNSKVEVYLKKKSESAYNLNRTVQANGLDIGLNNMDEEFSVYLKLIEPCLNDTVVSDTFFNDLIEPIDVGIDSISVEDRKLVIGWSKSSSRDLAEYVLYYTDKNNVSHSIDTVARNVLGYTWAVDSIDLLSRSVTIKIAGIDSCGNSTVPLNPHSSLVLSLTGNDVCAKKLSFSRNTYQGWDVISDSVKYALILRDTNSVEYGRIPFNKEALDVVFDTVSTGEYEVELIANSPVGTSTSGRQRIRIGSDRLIDDFELRYVSHGTLADSIYLKWRLGDTIGVAKVNVLVSQRSNEKSFRLLKSFTKDDSVAVFSKESGPYFQVRLISRCGSLIGISRIQRVIDLRIETPQLAGRDFNSAIDKERSINWSAYINWAGGPYEYQIERSFNGLDWTSIGMTQDTFYTDTEDLDDGTEYNDGVFYRVLGKETGLSASDIDSSYSNVVQVNWKFHGDIPNSFKPDDMVYTIKIEGSIDSLSWFKVYNRIGQEIFYTDNLARDSWNGKFQNTGADCPPEIYYVIGSVRMKSGEKHFFKQPVMLLR